MNPPRTDIARVHQRQNAICAWVYSSKSQKGCGTQCPPSEATVEYQNPSRNMHLMVDKGVCVLALFPNVPHNPCGISAGVLENEGFFSVPNPIRCCQNWLWPRNLPEETVAVKTVLLIFLTYLSQEIDVGQIQYTSSVRMKNWLAPFV